MICCKCPIHILLFSFKEEADAKCYECCQKAIEYDATNPEAFQLMASCLLSQQNMEEARKMLEKSLDLWQGKEDELPQVWFYLPSLNINLNTWPHSPRGDIQNKSNVNSF